MIRTRLAALAAGLLASGAVMFAAAPAFATTPLTACTPAAAAPLYTSACLPAVAGGTSAGAVTITVPGVGTVSLTLTSGGTFDPTTATATATGANFSAGTPVVSPNGTHVTVTFINAANPAQKYVVKAKVVQTNPTTVGGAAGTVVTSKLVVPGMHDHKNKGHDQEGDGDHDDDNNNQGQAPLLQSSTNHGDHGSWTSGSGGQQQSGGGGHHSDGGGGD
jgi:uncharacterized membrane protein YgcG